MHLGLKQLREFFDQRRGEDHLVLATVIATEGSTYRKPGAMMLIAEDGEFTGLISGGCLENDLVRQALLELPVKAEEIQVILATSLLNSKKKRMIVQ